MHAHRNRKEMSVGTTAALLVAVLAFAAPVSALAADAPPVATLTVSGEGTVEVTPDIVTVTIGVTSRAKTAGAALEANSGSMDAVIKSIRAAGIADKDIGTSGLSVEPLYEQPPTRDDGSQAPAKLIGYEVTNQLRIVIRDLAASGALLDKVVGAGANQVNGIAFDLADRQKPSDAALQAAIAEARRKAGLMAGAAGVRLVRILSVTTGETGGPYPLAAAPMKAMARAVPVMPGQQQISVTATLTYEIAPN